MASGARGKVALEATRFAAGRFMRWQARYLARYGRGEEFEDVMGAPLREQRRRPLFGGGGDDSCMQW
jgi:hypothetical protein